MSISSITPCGLDAFDGTPLAAQIATKCVAKGVDDRVAGVYQGRYGPGDSLAHERRELEMVETVLR